MRNVNVHEAWPHRDPFDRLLLAHALEDGHTIVTRDPACADYGGPPLMA